MCLNYPSPQNKKLKYAPPCKYNLYNSEPLFRSFRHSHYLDRSVIVYLFTENMGALGPQNEKKGMYLLH